MNLHEWLKYNKLDFNTITKIERAYYNNTYYYSLNENELVLLVEWLADPERRIENV